MAKKHEDEAISPEWSHMIDVEQVEDQPVKLSIMPNAEEIQALLPRLGVDGLSDFKADLTLKRQGQTIHVTGVLSAKVTQGCVVTLDPVETHISDEFEAWFADPEQAVSIAKARRDKQREKGGVELPMMEESEDPEAIVDGMIDVGELAVQYLVLSINPYPHAEGVEYEIGDDTPQGDMSVTRKNPFAALKEWKDKLK